MPSRRTGPAPCRRRPSTARSTPSQELGLVGHTHVDHRAPSYHLAEHATHLHVVCRGCGWVGEAPLTVADELVARIDESLGFAVRHLARRRARAVPHLPRRRAADAIDDAPRPRPRSRAVPAPLAPRRRRGPGGRRRRRRALRRPHPGAAPPRRGPRGGRPLAPRRRDGHRARPPDLAALDDDPAARRARAARVPRVARAVAQGPRRARPAPRRRRRDHVDHGRARHGTRARRLAGVDAVHAPGRGRRRDRRLGGARRAPRRRVGAGRAPRVGRPVADARG